ncbi:hypothetical protein [Tropicibacter alexandrii]|uniref:hypothetical protein n=1 Tax=Tropicibacter alexandrii TaxID=2267683 RepID=UPI000EF49241|nr:hypothetical protein [Tropicibacter alexandrii]
MQFEIGRFDSRTHCLEYEIGPYGRVSLGHGISNVALVDCDAAALQMVCDGRATRLDVGASLPANGHQRFLRNPYAAPVIARVLVDLPTQLSSTPRRETDVEISAVHRHFAFVSVPGVADRRAGIAFLPRRGRWSISATISGSTFRIVNLPRAKLDYIQQMPLGMLQANENDALFAARGTATKPVVIRGGTYNDAETAQWIADTGWNETPQTLAHFKDSFTGYADAETALWFSAVATDRSLSLSFELVDMGDWSPEWTG